MKQKEDGSQALKLGREQLSINLATVLQEKHLICRETNRRKK